MTRTRSLWLVIVLLGSLGFGEHAKTPPETDPDRAILVQAGLPTDDASLMRFFRTRTLTPEDELRLHALVRQLGDRSFRKREQAMAELRAAGRAALVIVRPATQDPDPEIAWRARRCVQTLDSDAEIERIQAAARLLARRKPAGAAEVVMGYLPFAHDERIEEEITHTLAAVAWPGDQASPVFVQALHDPEPVKRAAAAQVLGGGKDPRLRLAVRPLLHDPVPQVRLQAAQGLLRSGDRDAVAALIDLLADAPQAVRWQARDLLCDLAGDRAPPVMLGEARSAQARKARDTWQHWWDTHQDRLDLARLARADRTLGYTLLVAIDGYDGQMGRVWEVSRSGRALWSLKGVNRPMDARVLPGNRVLVAEYGGRVITIRDRHTGKVLNSYPINGNPSDIQALPNGHIFCAVWPNALVELTSDGQQVFSFTSTLGSITSGQKLRNGHIVYVTQNGFLAELDAKGKELRHLKFTEPNGWRLGLDVLPGPRYLVAHQGANKVIEYDRTGKPLWECAAHSPTQVTRLKNGNTLIACNDNHVIEVNRAGKVVWEQRLQGRPFRARRR